MIDFNLDLRTALVGDLVVDAASRHGMICQILNTHVKVRFDREQFTYSYTYKGQPYAHNTLYSAKPLVKHCT